MDINKVNINKVHLNTVHLNCVGCLSKVKNGGGGTVEPTLPDPIASYRCYDKTNDDEDRDVLKDLTGNGHDIQLYNFGFSRESGYGLYYITQKGNYKITNVKDTGNILLKLGVPENTIVTLEIKGLPDGALLECRASLGTHFIADKDGIYSTPPFEGAIGVAITGFTGDCEIDIIEYPQYQGALVSDGVDDYGLCENFPILTKDKGYTVFSIRKIFNSKNGYLFSNASTTSGADGFCQFERLNSNSTKSYGSENLNMIYPNLFSYQTSLKYNEVDIKSGSKSSKDTICIFCHDYYSKQIHVGVAALYALEIYDRDLTDEEIAKVKARMIAEYEEKTGNKYEEETV